MVFGGCALNEKHRPHQYNSESVYITSVPYFLIEKNAKYILGASSERLPNLESIAYMWFLVAVLLTKNVDHISRTPNQFDLHQYLISLLRKT